VSASLEITYAAHTSSCTFLLDSEGICRRIVVAPTGKHPSSSKGRDARSAARCVGAQYVASLDPSVSGMLAEMPRVGAAMLFARVDERGRVALVRTGVVTRFERHRAEDPFVETGEVPSMSVETSAPMIAPTPRASRLPQDPYEDEDAIDRTQPIQALRPAALRSLHKGPAFDQPVDDDATLDQTGGAPEASRERMTWPSPGNEDPSAPPTLRQIPALVPFPPFPPPRAEDPAAHARGGSPRRHDQAHLGRARAERGPRTGEAGRTPSPSTSPPADKVAGRGRGGR
jgi:hypothetical protein